MISIKDYTLFHVSEAMNDTLYLHTKSRPQVGCMVD